MPKPAACLWFALALAGLPHGPAGAAAPLDATPRIAVLSAYPPEAEQLQAAIEAPSERFANGVRFTLGRLGGKDVVLALSGISMVNAAMTTQLLLDRFQVEALVVSGIAGGVDPGLAIGDVVAPARWGQYLEAIFARQVAGEDFTLPSWAEPTFPNYGMIFPQPIEVRRAGAKTGTRRFWFEADPGMLAAAAELAKRLALDRCTAAQACLDGTPRLVTGGHGVSGQAFVDNAAFRRYTQTTFQARVLDMETAAIATVAYANQVPFLAFRSLSDLAGGGPGENEIGTFFQLAADNAAAVVIAFLNAWSPE